MRGLFYGDTSQFFASVLGVIACAAWTGTVTFVAFRLIDAVSKHRVPPSTELGGLDVPEMGIEGYAVEIGGNE